jgi:hypothetical protein
MKNEADQFIAEGMTRYEQASSVLVTFRREVEAKLKSILNSRTDWGQFTPNINAQAIKTTFGKDYPLLNAKLDGEYKGDPLKIVIAVNWYQSQSDYPFYNVWLEPTDKSPSYLEEFVWDSEFEFEDGGLRFYPEPDDFDLARDFNILLDEFIRAISD